MVDEDNQSIHNENNENNRVRTLRDYMNPKGTSSCEVIFTHFDISYLMTRSTENTNISYLMT
jgi:hypothetical protein